MKPIGARQIRRSNRPSGLQQGAHCRRAEQDGKGIGAAGHPISIAQRFRLYPIVGRTRSTVCTDGLNSYREMKALSTNGTSSTAQGWGTLPPESTERSLLKRWMLGTHQGAIGYQHLDDYLNEFLVHRRKSTSRGKLFFGWHSRQIAPTTTKDWCDHKM